MFKRKDNFYSAPGVATGKKKSLMDISTNVREKRAYEDVSHKELQQMVLELKAHKESCEKGKRLSAKSRTNDITYTLRDVSNTVSLPLLHVKRMTADGGGMPFKLHTLRQRTGITAMVFAICDCTEFKMEPFTYFTDPNAERYLSECRRIDILDFCTRFEGWALSRMPGE